MNNKLTRRQFLKTSTLASAILMLPQLSEEPPPVIRSVVCPILMYHYVSPLPENADQLRADLTVTPERFMEHLVRLQEDGFTAISFASLLNGMYQGAPLPEKPIIFSFDDGYGDAYHFAAPLLAQQGMVGTFFVVTNFVNQPGYLTWDQIRELNNAGMESGSHSVSHPNLTAINYEDIKTEVGQSADIIAEQTGLRPTTFCYPLGRYDWRCIAALREAGYQAAVTIYDGTIQYSAYPFTWRRARVRGSYGPNAVSWLANRLV